MNYACRVTLDDSTTVDIWNCIDSPRQLDELLKLKDIYISRQRINVGTLQKIINQSPDKWDWIINILLKIFPYDVPNQLSFSHELVTTLN